jgi:hypothetical protein
MNILGAQSYFHNSSNSKLIPAVPSPVEILNNISFRFQEPWKHIDY